LKVTNKILKILIQISIISLKTNALHKTKIQKKWVSSTINNKISNYQINNKFSNNNHKHNKLLVLIPLIFNLINLIYVNNKVSNLKIFNKIVMTINPNNNLITTSPNHKINHNM